MDNEPCTQAHLEALIPQWSFWSVDSDGTALNPLSDGDLGLIEEYHCFNCGEYFAPDKPGRLDDAWRAALDYLAASPNIHKKAV